MSDSPNIVLIIADAMRKDVLRAYNGTAETPHIDEFVKDSSIYKNCIAPAPWTLPSHVSFFTGKYASEHGIHETYDKKLLEILAEMRDFNSETIAEHLKKLGYSTLGFSSNWMLSLHKGFDRGFDYFYTIDEIGTTSEEKELFKRASVYGRNPSQVFRYLLLHGKFKELVKLYSAFRRTRAIKRTLQFPFVKGGDRLVKTITCGSFGKPFFLFANLIETHDPYTQYEQSPSNKVGFSSVQMADLYGVKTIPEQAIQEIRSRYYSSSKYFDLFFGKIINHLKEKGLYDNSLIILTADHGQALKEKGFYGHGTFLHDEIVEVPLIIKYPGGARHETGPQYQSLVDLPAIIKQVVNGGDTAELLNRQVVFSESFGANNKPPNSTDNERINITKLNEVRRRVDVPRKAVYKDGYKLVVNWATGEVEEFTHNKKILDIQTDAKKLNELKEELSSFASSVKLAEMKPEDRAVLETFSKEEEEMITDRLRTLGYA